MRQPRQQRGIDKVTAILGAARELLQTEDAAAVTTTSVAQRAGVPVASLYRYFDDVDDVLDVLVGEHAAAAEAAVEAALDAGPSTSVAEVLRRLLDAHLDLYASRPELTRVWFSPQLAARQREVELRTDRRLASRLGRHLVDAGLLDELSPATTRRLEAHWETAGTLLGLVLRADEPLRSTLVGDLRAVVDTFAARLTASP